MESIVNFFKNLGGFVGRMTPSQVMMLFGVVAGSIVGVVLIVGWVSDISYSRLYSNLGQEEAGEIVNYLNDNKISYRLSENGGAIEVPSGDVYATRISLASQGIPRSGSVGYSIFDQNNLGMTDFLQNLNFRRALEGELTRTIMQLNEVKAARVHIVMPKERLFKEDQKQATASVLLKLSGKGGLSKQQLNGITHLVASSVEGLQPKNIAIIDYDGNLLSSNQGSDPTAGLSSTQLEVRKNVEAYLEDKAQSMLDGVLGDGRSLVRVTADLDFQQLERTSETFDPNAPSVRSEERTKNSNSSTDKAAEANESNDEGSSETTITNYELNKTVEHMVNAVGGIQRLTVAVTVDGSYSDIANDAGDVESIYQPRSQDELDRLASLVRTSVGFDTQRNDQLEIVNIPFDRRNLDGDRELLDSMYQREFIMDMAKKIGTVLLALMVLLYLKKKSRRLFGALSSILPPPAPAPSPMMETRIPEREEREFAPIEPEKRKPRLVDAMQKTAKDRPDEIAKVIKTMMIE
ncbi:MAG: flagellar M-ring protein FliF [candidate division Zixibacteria bacterium]|nr:flagellar M-ring protein FliF [candidate division Zixibacteria bacterium]